MFKGQILFLKGDALRSLESYQEAVPLLVDAVDLAPSNIHAWMALGWCYKRIGRLDEAIDSLERAHEVEPTEPLIDYNLACYYSLKGLKHRAIDYPGRGRSAPTRGSRTWSAASPTSIRSARTPAFKRWSDRGHA